MNQPSDTYYIGEVLKGNLNAFSILVDRYKSFVYTITYRVVKNEVDAEEVAQETFIKAYQSLKSYKGASKFSTWLYTIAYRKSLDYLKKYKKEVSYSVLETIQDINEIEVDNALKDIEEEERKTIIANSIKELPPDEAVIITLYYYEEKSIKEIVEITNLKADNVKVKLYRSRKKLHSILKHYILPEITRNNGRAI